tara:strand:+ start:1544 stop:1822 length:279 start_codon:yes stop_codon:yes gene_type:complete
MIKKDNFGDIAAKIFEIGDIVEWTTWCDKEVNWISSYGIIIKIENQIKSNRLVSISTIKPINETYNEIELFTISLKKISEQSIATKSKQIIQ